MTLKTPTHPGESVLYDCLEPLGLSVTAGAEALGISRYRLSEIIKCRARITPEIAIRLSKAFGGTAKVWYHLQTAWDKSQADRNPAEDLNDVHLANPIHRWRGKFRAG